MMPLLSFIAHVTVNITIMLHPPWKKLFYLQYRGSACIVGGLVPLGPLVLRGTWEQLLVPSTFFLTFPPPRQWGGLGPQSSGLRITPESFRVVQLEMLSFIHSHLHPDAWCPFPGGGGGSRSRHQCVCFIVLYLRKLSHLKMGEHLCPIFPGMYN